ncbi:MAG: LacI family DNA-binding transcriptional regulator [Desulfitobacteriaceae bacterium]
MITMKEVANLAKVSVATVSAVINNSAYVSDQLRERVLEAINVLGYRPNALARSLKKSKTQLLGFIVKDITNPFYPEMLHGAEDAARKAGYNMLVCTTSDETEREEKYLESLLELRIDGIILATIDEATKLVAERLNKEQTPFVLINRWPDGYKGCAVGADNLKAGMLATQHLISLGHKEIAFIGASKELVTSRYREEGYRQVLKENGLDVPEHFLRYCEYSEEKAYLAYEELAKKGNVPKAVFAANDLMGFGAARALWEAGYKIPDDVAFVGCDDIEFSKKFLIPLTTVYIPKYEMGKLAVEMLLKNIEKSEGYQNDNSVMMLEPHLVIRKSSRSEESREAEEN